MRHAVRLDVGAGKQENWYYKNVPIHEYIRIDASESVNPDIKAGADKLPFKNDSVDDILCIHTLEHTGDDIATLREFHRVLKKGGRLFLIVPYAFGCGAFLGGIHRFHYTFETFYYFAENHTKAYYFDFHFASVKTRFKFNCRTVWTFYHKLVELIANKFPWGYENTALRVFPCSELWVEMIK